MQKQRIMRSHHIRVEDRECGAERTSRRDFKVLLTRQKRVSAHFCSRSAAQNWPHQLAIVVNNQRNIVYHRSRPIIRQSQRLVQQACANSHYRKCADTAKIGHTSAWSLASPSAEHVRLRACQQIPRTRTAAAPNASKCNGKLQPFATILALVSVGTRPRHATSCHVTSLHHVGRDPNASVTGQPASRCFRRAARRFALFRRCDTHSCHAPRTQACPRTEY